MFNQIVPKLRQALQGLAHLPGDAAYANAVKCFNTATVHQPDLVICPTSTSDIVHAVNLANEFKCPLHLQATGHGSYTGARGGILLNTESFSGVKVDSQHGTAQIAAGTRWKDVVAAASPFGYTPITGSSPEVGAIGYMLGGGFGPMARTFGVSSDYVLGYTVVTHTGEIIQANKDQNPDLFWALSGGGRIGFGIVTEMHLRLVKLEKIFGGSLFFEEHNIEKVLRTWADWTKNADPNVTTSVAIVKFPPLEIFPEHLRGRRLLTLRFVYPGSAEAGAKLAEPLTTCAPIYFGKLDELPAADLGKVHNDPTQPGPAWVGGSLVKHIDQNLITHILNEFGANTNSPFAMVEMRHLGGAMRVNAPQLDAVSGRLAEATLNVLGKRPDLFDTKLPEAEEKLLDTMRSWLLPERNINFTGKSRSEQDFLSIWPRDICQRLLNIQAKYDPERRFFFNCNNGFQPMKQAQNLAQFSGRYADSKMDATPAAASHAEESTEVTMATTPRFNMTGVNQHG